MSRILKIPKSSIQSLLLRAAVRVSKPLYTEAGQDYEVDELYSFVGNEGRQCWLIYAINRQTRQIVDFVVGHRTKENISGLLNTLYQLFPRRIYTDKLPVYRSLIPTKIHRSFLYGTNRIERKNLTLRTHLKRLSRRTMCFSKSLLMIEACFKLYAWC